MATPVGLVTELGPAPGRPAVQVRALSKTFAGGRALSSVELQLDSGQVHALLGENGSGKSTLIKVLSGYHRPDPGSEILVGGEPLTLGSPMASHQAGARFVHQDLGLIETASLSDNLAYGSGFPTRFGTIRRSAARHRAAEALARVELDISPDTLVSALSPAQKTGVAVARALLAEPGNQVRLLVLDEPTARLPVHEVEHLLGIVRTVVASGVAVLYVTHRLDEVFEIAHQATVLRDGHRVATAPVASLSRDDLLHHLLGAALESAHRHAPHPDTSATSHNAALVIENLHSDVLHGLSLQVQRGEVVGIAGITGSGREALCASVFGARPRDRGTVHVGGQLLRSDRPDQAMALGAAYVPSERKLQGAFLELTARENISIASLPAFWRWGRLRRGHERRIAASWFERFGIRPNGGEEQLLSTLSGGNQQKVVFSKWFQRAPVLFLLDEPTQGVDVGAKAELHRALFDAARGGAGILMSSSDMDELVTTCDRVLVLRAGRVVAELRGSQINPHTMARAALGVTQPGGTPNDSGAAR